MLTIITTPRPLGLANNRMAFLNAIRSWVRVEPRLEVLVFGGDRALIEEEGGYWVDGREVYGRPYFDDFIGTAEILSSNDVLMYCTDHLILTSDLVPTVERVCEAFPGNFVIVGKRWQLDVREDIDFSNPNWEAILRGYVLWVDSLGSQAAKDYIIFRQPLDLSVPNFIMGYPWYDTWFVWAALQAGYPVIDASATIMAIHQSHKFPEGNVEARERTPGGRYNRKLGISLGLDGKGAISHASHIITYDGISKRP